MMALLVICLTVKTTSGILQQTFYNWIKCNLLTESVQVTKNTKTIIPLCVGDQR